MDADQTYRYEALIESDAIRLLELKPAQDLQAKVECSLVHTTLSACADDLIDHYTALSYVWGNPKYTTRVSVDGKELDVTVNLDSALRHLRDPRRKRLVWADAICIDQANDEEKNQQVAQMCTVYETAQHTIIFLGEATEKTDIIFNRCRGTGPITSEGWEDLKWDSVLSRPWFTRVWIYQELMFSVDPWLQCGCSRVRWSKFHDTLENLKRLHLMRPRNRVLASFSHMATEKRAFLNSRQLQKSPVDFADSLLNMLQARRGLGVLDPRDMLFAHRATLGIAAGTDEEKSLIKVDYGKSCAEVYGDLARYIWQMMIPAKRYEMFSYVELPTEFTDQGLNIPTWAPNWMSKGRPKRYRGLRRELFRETSDLPLPKFRFHMLYGLEKPQLWVDPSVFATVGFRVGKLCKTTDIITAATAAQILQSKDFELLPGHHKKSYEKWSTMHDPLKRQLSSFIFKYCQAIVKPLAGESGPKFEGTATTVSQNVPKLETLFWHPDQLYKDCDSLVSHLTKYNGHFKSVNFKLQQQLMNHAVKEALHPWPGRYSGKYDGGIFYDRKFAILGTGRLVLVPGSAREGDNICFFAEDNVVSYVLRPRIVSADKAERIEHAIRSGMGHEETMEVKHFNFVGESWVDVGPGLEELEEVDLIDPAINKEMEIFAIH